MHFDFITRGNRIDVNKFISNVESMYFKNILKKDGKIIHDGVYNIVMRPIQLWEAIANKEDMPMVIKTINPIIRNPYLSKYVSLLRIALKLKKMPTIDDDVNRRAIWNQNIEIFPIGIKNDEIDKDGNELL